MPLYSPNNIYRLELADDGTGARTIELEALSAEAALQCAQPHCSGREAELFEDGRSLGLLRCTADGDYWTMSGTRATR